MITLKCKSTNGYSISGTKELSCSLNDYLKMTNELYKDDDVHDMTRAMIDSYNENDDIIVKHIRGYIGKTYGKIIDNAITCDDYNDSLQDCIITINNPNSLKFSSFVDEMSSKYNDVILVNSIFIDPSSDHIYLVVMNKHHSTNDSACNTLPMNIENIISFLYNVYSFRLYYLELVRDYVMKRSANNIRFVNMNVKDEFKQLIAMIDYEYKQITDK